MIEADRRLRGWRELCCRCTFSRLVIAWSIALYKIGSITACASRRA